MGHEEDILFQTMDQRAFVAELSRQLVAKAAEVRHAIIRLAVQMSCAPIGSCLSLVDVACALFYQYLNLDPEAPGHPGRDRVVLSKAHALLMLQPILAELSTLPEGLSTILVGEHSRADAIQEIGPCPGLDAAPRVPGTGLGLALGYALAGQIRHQDWRVYCLMGDGECSDGGVWEAAMVAAHYRLGNLVAIVDRNKLCAAGPTMRVLDVEPLAGKWLNMGWDVIEIDGHNMNHVVWAFETLPQPSEPKPVVIIANTTSGAGVDFMEDRLEWRTGHVTEEFSLQAHASIDVYARRCLDRLGT